jgi:hypothetical protein
MTLADGNEALRLVWQMAGVSLTAGAIGWLLYMARSM